MRPDVNPEAKNFDASGFVSQLPFWEHLTPDEKNRLCGSLTPVHYKAGHSIHSGELNCLGTIFVKTGILRVYLSSLDGREATIYRLRAGEVCILSASCMLASITFDALIDAETDCELYLIPTAVFSALMKSNIYVENFAYRFVTERFSDVIAAMERMFFLTLKQRIAAFLIDESAAQKTDCLDLTQEQLARAIGSAREAVSRSLKQLSQEGRIEISRGKIKILDKNFLYQILS